MKSVRHGAGDKFSRRSPSWGAWIEIHLSAEKEKYSAGRSPSWGAWIEILSIRAEVLGTASRSPSWGAWIEIFFGRLRYGGDRAASLPLVGSVD